MGKTLLLQVKRMSNSTVILRIQELTKLKSITLEELSQASNVSIEVVQAYATEPVNIGEAANDLRKIANQLNVSVIDLVKPVVKREAFKLRILEVAKQKGISLNELSERSNVNPETLAFYSTQPICKQKFFESIHQINISKINKVLECCIEDLKVATDLPKIRLRVEELAAERGLSLENLKQLSGLSSEFIDLIATQPVDPLSWKQVDSFLEGKDACCQVCDLTHSLGCSCCKKSK